MARTATKTSPLATVNATPVVLATQTAFSIASTNLAIQASSIAQLRATLEATKLSNETETSVFVYSLIGLMRTDRANYNDGMEFIGELDRSMKNVKGMVTSILRLVRGNYRFAAYTGKGANKKTTIVTVSLLDSSAKPSADKLAKMVKNYEEYKEEHDLAHFFGETGVELAKSYELIDPMFDESLDLEIKALLD